MSTTKKHEKSLRFCGPYQPSVTRLPAAPKCDYANGGDDFRCSISPALGKQVTSHRKTAGYVPISTAARFGKSNSVGPGPIALAPYSSLNKQFNSNKRSAGSIHLGTSTRDSCLKLYAIYTYKKL